MKQEEIKEKYALLDQSAADPTRYNNYICSHCHTNVKTVDRHVGVTPMFMSCPDCGRNMFSTFYRDLMPGHQPTIEWFRPTLEETLAWNKTVPGMVDHILAGGLDYREIK